MTLAEKIQQDKIEAKIVLEVLETLKPILEKYKGRKVLKVDGSLIKALRDELEEELKVIKETYNNYDSNIKGSSELHRLYLSGYGLSNCNECLKIDFSMRYSRGDHDINCYFSSDAHYIFGMVEEGILIHLDSQVLENNLNKIKSYNIKSIVGKCKRVDAYLAKIEEIEDDLPRYANHNIRGGV